MQKVKMDWEKACAAQTIDSRRFDCRDEKGRQLGAQVFLLTVEAVPFVDNGQGWGGVLFDLGPGTFFAFRPHATRDGKTYGALQTYRYFRTEAERAAAVAAYFKAAEDRARKANVARP